jgi:hypothetical protein
MITRTRRARPTTPSPMRHRVDTPSRATLPTPCGRARFERGQTIMIQNHVERYLNGGHRALDAPFIPMADTKSSTGTG